MVEDTPVEFTRSSARAERRGVAVRHGMQRPRSAVRTFLRTLGASVCVVALSATGVAAYGAWDVARSMNEGVSLNTLSGKKRQPIPDIAAIDGGVNLLLVGTDSRKDLGGSYDNPEDQAASSGDGNNDVTMLLHVAADHRSATIVSFPRDLMVDIPDCSDPVDGRSHRAQFNSALADGGLSCVGLTVSKLTGVDVPFGAVVNFNGVSALSNAVGGVTVCLASPVRDKYTRPALNLDAGEHTLVGEEAQAFLRSRHGVGDESDLARISSQQVFMSALARKIVSGGVLANPVQLYALAKATVMNVTPSDTLQNPSTLVQIGLALKDTGLENIVFLQYPVVTDPDDVNRVVPDRAAAAAVNEALVGDKPIALTGSIGRAAEEVPATPGTPADQAPATNTPSPVPTEVAALPETVTGQTAAQQTCAKGSD